MDYLKKHKYIILISISFAIIYALISIVNHYYFRTAGLDLGLYTNAAYKYAHFQMADSTMIKEFYEPLLGGHFDLYLILFSPLIYLFGTYTLLIVQIAALIFGGVGVYRYFQISGNPSSSLFAALYFFLFFGLYGALSFDYHSVVVASCVVPWFFTSIYQSKIIQSSVLFLLMLISQENISIWLFFLCIGLAIEYRKNIKKVYLLMILSVFSMVYFFIITSYVIPYFSAQNEYGGLHYSFLGDNVFNAIYTLLSQPIESLKVLFTNHIDSPFGDLLKVKLHIILLISGLPILIKKPHYLLMLLPIFFQKLFHDNILMWGTDYHYNIEFAPILAIGIFSVLAEYRNIKWRKTVSLTVLFFVTVSTALSMRDTISFIDKTTIRFYKKEHYHREFNVREVRELLSDIPKDAKVSAQSLFVPHLSLRNHIYQFPIIKDAQYIIYRKGETHYPLTNEEFEIKTMELEKSEKWEFHHKGEIVILKKK
jgi:uncharacterized membrane protein